MNLIRRLNSRFNSFFKKGMEWTLQTSNQTQQRIYQRIHLKRHRFPGNRKFLLLGLEKSGKTELLRHSGLSWSRVPETLTPDLEGLLKEMGARGDWWFCKEAMIYELPAVFLTEKDGKEWQEFIQNTKKLRRKESFSGLLITTSLNDLQRPDFDKNLEQLRYRIHELYQRLGVCLPVTLILTHLDTLDGFSSFFESFNDLEKQQALGISFEGKQDVLEAFTSGMSTLDEHLISRMFTQLPYQKSAQIKSQSIQFPAALRLRAEAIAEMIKRLMKEDIYQEKMRLKGVYLTAIGYFTEELLLKRIFTAPLTCQLSQKKKKERQWVGYARFGVLAGLTVFSLFALTLAALENRKLLHQGVSLVESEWNHASMESIQAFASHLHSLRHFTEEHSFIHRLGMVRVASQQDIYEKLFSSAVEKDFHQVSQRFLTQELIQFQNRWATASDDVRESIRGDYYTAFKLYLMIHFPQHLEVQFAKQALAKTWALMQSDSEGMERVSKDSLLMMSEVYLESLKSKPSRATHYNESLIQRVRADLITASGVLNYYRLAKNEWSDQLGLLSYDALFEDMGLDLWHSEQAMSKFFTMKAFVSQIKPYFVSLSQQNLRKDWVIHARIADLISHKNLDKLSPASSKEHSRFMQELLTLYLTEYFKAWLQCMSQLKVVPLQSIEDSAEQLRVLDNPSGPFKSLFSELANNLQLEKGLSSKEMGELPLHLKTRFKDLASILEVKLNKNPLLEHYLKQLSVLQQEMERLLIGGESNEMTTDYVLSHFQSKGDKTELLNTAKVVEKLTHDMTDVSARHALKELLLAPVKSAWQAVLNEAAVGLQQQWEQAVLIPFRERLAPYFPFNKQGQPVSLTELSLFFKPDTGVFSRYLNRVMPFLKKEDSHYVIRQWLDEGLPLSSHFLNQITQLDALIHSLYSEGGHVLSFQYAVYPIPAPGIKEILFASNNQSYPYRNGPQEWVYFRWPSKEASDNETFIRITDAGEDNQLTKTYQGTWSLFYLLQAATGVKKVENGYQLEWAFKSEGKIKTIKWMIAPKTSSDVFGAFLFKPLQLVETIKAQAIS